jgi:radical SAM superfamily enzyme YgiQ (UPF0313 family)
MLGLDEDTPEYLASIPDKLNEVDPSTVLLSITIPIPGTPLHQAVEAEGRIVDRNLAHYEGDHLVFRPKSASPAQIFEAFRRINRSFYSWTSILKRWWRLMRKQSPRGNLAGWILHTAVISAVFFKLSIFQRDHAQHRVYPMNALKAEKPSGRALAAPAA